MTTMKQSCIIVITSVVVHPLPHGFLPLLVINANIIITTIIIMIIIIIIIISSSIIIISIIIIIIIIIITVCVVIIFDLKDNDYVNSCCCLIKLVDADINMNIIMLSPKQNTSKYLGFDTRLDFR